MKNQIQVKSPKRSQALRNNQDFSEGHITTYHLSSIKIEVFDLSMLKNKIDLDFTPYLIISNGSEEQTSKLGKSENHNHKFAFNQVNF